MTAHEHDNSSVTSASNGTSNSRLAIVAGINFLGFLVELAGGLLFGSVALLSDAFHMLFDMLAYVLAFSASYTAEQFDEGYDLSYGLHRLEPVAAFLNGVLLIPMVGYILWESYKRFLDPVVIEPVLTLIIAVGGLLVNVASVYFLKGNDMSLNERGAFYHLLGDAGGSVAVIISTAAIAVWDVPIADPIAAVFIGMLVLWSAGRVLFESSSILLERSPLPIETVHTELPAIDGVEEVTDLHIWQVCSQLSVATVRIVVSSEESSDRRAIRNRVHEYFETNGIDHSTVELIEVDERRDRSPPDSHSH